MGTLEVRILEVHLGYRDRQTFPLPPQTPGPQGSKGQEEDNAAADLRGIHSEAARGGPSPGEPPEDQEKRSCEHARKDSPPI
jgi:hypothetical protein